MGRLEKIVVLTVLFLVAVILAVSLNQGEDGRGGVADPLASDTLAAEAPPSDPAPHSAVAQDALAQAEPRGDARPTSTPVHPERPAGALSALVGERPDADLGEAATDTPGQLPDEPLSPVGGAPQAEEPAAEADAGPAAETPVAPPPEPAAPESWLVSEEGLQPSLLPGTLLYAWTDGDTFAAVAERYYGSSQRVDRLHKANEGRLESSLQAGELIFVPARAPAADEVLDPTPSGAGQWYGGTYIVKPGDILGKIAQDVYGAASKWRVIYDANRDVLASPDALQVGMKLRIPALD